MRVLAFPYTAIEEQLRLSGCYPYILTAVEVENGIRGKVQLSLINKLKKDGRFLSSPLHALHADVGPNRCEFRSITGAFGEGSMQIVINRDTGAFFADIDKFNPAQDAVGAFGHLFGEVIPNLFRKLFGRRKKK